MTVWRFFVWATVGLPLRANRTRRARGRITQWRSGSSRFSGWPQSPVVVACTVTVVQVVNGIALMREASQRLDTSARQAHDLGIQLPPEACDFASCGVAGFFLRRTDQFVGHARSGGRVLGSGFGFRRIFSGVFWRSSVPLATLPVVTACGVRDGRVGAGGQRDARRAGGRASRSASKCAYRGWDGIGPPGVGGGRYPHSSSPHTTVITTGNTSPHDTDRRNPDRLPMLFSSRAMTPRKMYPAPTPTANASAVMMMPAIVLPFLMLTVRGRHCPPVSAAFQSHATAFHV